MRYNFLNIFSWEFSSAISAYIECHIHFTTAIKRCFLYLLFYIFIRFMLSNGWLLWCFKISEMQSVIKISSVFLKFWDGWIILLNSNSSVVWFVVVDHIQDWSLQITQFCLVLFLSSIIHKRISMTDVGTLLSPVMTYVLPIFWLQNTFDHTFGKCYWFTSLWL